MQESKYERIRKPMKKYLILLFLLLCVSSVYGAQITAVRYEGSTSISDTLATEISKIKPGDTLDIDKVDDAVIAFFQQGYFSDVYATFDNGVLTFHFKQRPKVASVEIKGYGNEQEKETLYNQIGIKKGDSYDEVKLERAKLIIKTVLEYQGYYGSVISEELTPIGSDDAYAITLNVNQGENIIITKAYYQGREKLSMSEVQELAANREKQFAGWLWGRNDGKLKLNDLEFDSARIQDAYMRKGFLDANVSPAFLEADFNDYSAQLHYKIQEGERYKISDVKIVLQDPVLSEETLLKKLKIQKNEYFNIENLRADMDIIKQEVADLGYAFTRVSPDLDKNTADSEVKVIYYVQIGQKVKINDVIITGNTRTQKSIDNAERLGAIDKGYLDPIECVKGADIIYLSTPVLQIVPLVEKILPHLKKGAILTDAGSTKSYIARQIMNMLPENIYYVAGHPMTGREKSGVTAANKDLFKNKCYVIVKDTKAPAEVLQKVVDLIKLTEANITTLTLEEHDRCASIISHIPHIVAAGLVNLLDKNPSDLEACITLAGGGFKDTTRIASSNADMWADVCISNAEPIIEHLSQLQAIFSNMITAIAKKDRQTIHDYFVESKTRRDMILEETKDKYDLI